MSPSPATTTSDAPAVSIEGLVKRYGRVTAVDGLDLELWPVRMLAVLGPNGAAKTTTIEVCEETPPSRRRPGASPGDRPSPLTAGPARPCRGHAPRWRRLSRGPRDGDGHLGGGLLRSPTRHPLVDRRTRMHLGKDIWISLFVGDGTPLAVRADTEPRAGDEVLLLVPHHPTEHVENLFRPRTASSLSRRGRTGQRATSDPRTAGRRSPTVRLLLQRQDGARLLWRAVVGPESVGAGDPGGVVAGPASDEGDHGEDDR